MVQQVKIQTGNKKKSTSPFEPMFKDFCRYWKDIHKNKIQILKEASLPRVLQRHIEEAKLFLYKWLDNEKTMREDYHEMAKLCLIYLGGELPTKMSEFEFRAPSAFHHARWMSKVIYILKIAMLKPQFVENIASIRSLALFYSVYYAKAWLTCMFASEAPSQDLEFLKTLEEVATTKGDWPIKFKLVAKSAWNKLKTHTWYLSERLIGLVLFSDTVDIETKEQIRCSILKQKQYPEHTVQQSPDCNSFQKKQLKDFVGPDTKTLFDLLKLDKDLLNTKVSMWNSTLYQKNRSIIKQLSVVNDAAERALGLLTSLHGQTMPKNEKLLQAKLKVVNQTRKVQAVIATSSERVTKKNLDTFEVKFEENF